MPELWPKAERHSPIAGILLTNGDIDHCLGLLSLRESHPLVLYATDAVRAGFTEGNVLYRTLERFPGQVTWRRLELGREQPLGGIGIGLTGGLRGDRDPRAGKLPVHLEGRAGTRQRRTASASMIRDGCGARSRIFRAWRGRRQRSTRR